MKEIQELILAKEFEKAETIINELLAQRPDNAAILFQQGYLEFSRSNFLKAQQIFDNVFAIDPKHYVALFNSAIIDEKNKLFDQALAKYIRVIQLKPDFKDVENAIKRLNSKSANIQYAENPKSSMRVNENASETEENGLGKLKYEWSPTLSSGIPYLDTKVLQSLFVFFVGCMILAGFAAFAFIVLSYKSESPNSHLEDQTIDIGQSIAVYCLSIFFLMCLFIIIRYIRQKKSKYKIFENGMELFISKPFSLKIITLYYVKINPDSMQLKSPFPFTLTDDAYILIQTGVSPVNPQFSEFVKLYTYSNVEETKKIYFYLINRITKIRDDLKKTLQ